MKTMRLILLGAAVLLVAIFGGCKHGGSGGLGDVEVPPAPTEQPGSTPDGQDGSGGRQEDPPGGQDGQTGGALRIEYGETLPVDDMGVEEIKGFLRGSVFQKGFAGMAAGYGELMCFSLDGNEYYWFCSSMDQQSRVRSEHGSWELEEGFMSFSTDRLVEWQGGSFSGPTGSTGSRFELNGYDVVVSPVDIESSFNFRMFKFGHPEPTDIQLGFTCGSFGDMYNLSSMGIDVLEMDYKDNFALIRG